MSGCGEKGDGDMRVKRLKVGIRSLEEGLQEFGATLKAIQRQMRS
jgi:hypothetical protein